MNLQNTRNLYTSSPEKNTNPQAIKPIVSLGKASSCRKARVSKRPDNMGISLWNLARKGNRLNDKTQRKAIVIIAGVMARSVRSDGHAGFTHLSKNILPAFRILDMSVFLWGFNLIPSKIDHDPVPPDGGRKYFPRFDKYCKYQQDELDRTNWVLERKKWTEDVVGLKSCMGSLNSSRRDAMIHQGMENLRQSLQKHEIRSNDFVVLASPEMIVGDLKPQDIRACGNRTVISLAGQGPDDLDGCGCKIPSPRRHNGFLAGTVEDILDWYSELNHPIRKTNCYEHWYGDSLRDFSVIETGPPYDHLIDGGRELGGCGRDRARLKGYKPLVTN